MKMKKRDLIMNNNYYIREDARVFLKADTKIKDKRYKEGYVSYPYDKEVHQMLNSCGHYKIMIDGHQHFVHRLMYQHFVGEIPQGYVIHHINHVKTDNRINNLQCLTNEAHSAIHKGTKRSRMTQEKKDKIKELYEQGLSQRKIAEILGISDRTVRTYLKN